LTFGFPIPAGFCCDISGISCTNGQIDSNLSNIYHGCLGFRNANNGMVKQGLPGHNQAWTQGILNASKKT